MTSVHGHPGLLRSAPNRGVLGLVLALTIVGWAGHAVAQSRTINLNTGYDQAQSQLIPVNGQDNEWRVIADPTNPPPPAGRPADVVTGGAWVAQNPALAAQFPLSQWISINPNRSPMSATVFQYVFYFSLPPGFSSPQLAMKLSADDRILAVTLNGNPLIASPGGAFTGAPLVIPPTTAPALFKSGSSVNAITVTVEDQFGVLTGLIVDGAVTYEDCDRPPVHQIPGLTSITFWERSSATPTSITFNAGDTRLQQQLVGPSITASPDFVGAPGEFYDVFYSTWDGILDPAGQFVTIEAVWSSGAPSGGGLNIGRVELTFGAPAPPQFADSVTSFIALGNNALPADVGNAVDALTTTATTMGSTSGATQRLRVTVGFPCSCATPPSDMVAWWPLDEPTGATIVNDIAPPPGSSANNQGIPLPGNLIGFPGPNAVAGQVNGALYFAGGYLDVAPHPDLDLGTGDFTIDAWIKPVSLFDAVALSLIVHKIDGAGKGYALYTLGNGSGGRFLALVLDGVTYTSSADISSTSWHHVAVTVQRSVNPPVGIFYINGVPVGAPALPTFQPTTADLNTASSLLIGASFLGGLPGLPVVGRHEFAIDELEIFKRALGQTEILAIYSAGSAGKGKCKPCLPPPPGMVAWYPMDEGAGAMGLQDLIGGNNATLFAAGVGLGGAQAPQPLPGVVGGAVYFPKLGNGLTGARVSPQGALAGVGAADFTIDAWVGFPAAPANRPHYIVNKFDAAQNRGYALYVVSPGIPGNERLEFTWGDGVNVATVQSISTLTAGQAHHVAVTFARNVGGNALDIRLYVDGTQQGQQTGSPPGLSSLVNFLFLEIGQQPGTLDEPMAIDELEIFNVALSASDVQSIYNAGSAGKCKCATGGQSVDLTVTGAGAVFGVGSGVAATVSSPLAIDASLVGCAGQEMFLVVKAPALGLPLSYFDGSTWVPLPSSLSQITPFALGPANGTYPVFSGALPPGTYDVYFACDLLVNGHLDITGPSMCLSGAFDYLPLTVP